MMIEAPVYLSDFQSCPTRFREEQGKILEFLADIHQSSANLQDDETPVGKLLHRYGVKDSKIGTRGFECRDIYVCHEARELYKLEKESPAGSNIQQRTHFFAERVNEVFNQFYQEEAPEPEHLIHVTCTGYISPSAPQRLVSQRNWSSEITHAYHMGCYASLPAVRMGMGQLGRKNHVDIIHTEICSIHMNPSIHTPEQLVVQSLFADGHIRYQLSSKKKGPRFQVIHIKEKILPQTEGDMSWMPGPHGMAMNLSREVPKRIEENIRDFTQSLVEKAGLKLDEVLKHGIFAVHPGGPKIIQTVSETLELREEQTQASQKVLFERGNMSSATLPHIWNEILASDPAANTPVVSLAFGPGLTIFGAVFEYQS